MRDGALFCGTRWWLQFGSDEGAAEDEQRRVNRQQIGDLERLWKMP
jgi:hypothetical protein